jgi:hypothetical protein
VRAIGITLPFDSIDFSAKQQESIFIRQAVPPSGGDLEQTQLLLGHASIQTTECNLGTRQNLVPAVNDNLPIEPELARCVPELKPARAGAAQVVRHKARLAEPSAIFPDEVPDGILATPPLQNMARFIQRP